MYPILISEASFIGITIPNSESVINAVDCPSASITKCTFSHCTCFTVTVLNAEKCNLDFSSCCVIDCYSTTFTLLALDNINYTMSQNLLTFNYVDSLYQCYFFNSLQNDPIQFLNISSAEAKNGYIFSLALENSSFEYCSFQFINSLALFDITNVNMFISNSIFDQVQTNFLSHDSESYYIIFSGCEFAKSLFNFTTQENTDLINCTFPKFINSNLNIYSKMCFQSSSMITTVTNINSSRIIKEYDFMVYISDCFFTNMRTLGDGSCISLDKVFSCSIDHCTFELCSASLHGGFLYATKLSQLSIKSSCCHKCSAFAGCTFYIGDSYSIINVETSQFISNYNTSLIYFMNMVEYDQSNITSNEQNIGLFFIYEGNFLTFQHCVIGNNTAHFLSSQVIELSFNYTLFTDNYFQRLWCKILVVSNSYFTKNFATDWEDDIETIVNNSFVDSNSTQIGFAKILPVGYLDLTFDIPLCYYIEAKKSYLVIILVSCIAFLVFVALLMGTIIFYLRKRSMKQQKRIELEKSLISDFG